MEDDWGDGLKPATTTEKDNYVFAGERLTKGGYGQGLRVIDYFATHVDISGMNIYETYCIAKGKNPTVLELVEYAADVKYALAEAMMKEREKYD